MASNVYVFDCVACGQFYGEQVLTRGGRLYCPVCLARERVSSPYVERVRVGYVVVPFDRSGVVS